MLIVLEGCDGAGKTELANFLAKVLDAEIVHCSTHTANNFNFFNEILYAARDKNIIADRFCYGQFVYQNDDNRPLADEHGSAETNLGILEIRMLQSNAKVIYVTAPVDVIEERLKARGEELINGLTVEEILDRYDTIIHNSLLPWTVYNTGRERS